jgi:hypothetical protein
MSNVKRLGRVGAIVCSQGERSVAGMYRGIRCR